MSESDNKTPERRTEIENPEEQRKLDITGIMKRIAREGIPVDQVKLREEGEEREKIMAAVLERAARLFGRNSDWPAAQPAQPDADGATESDQSMPESGTEINQSATQSADENSEISSEKPEQK